MSLEAVLDGSKQRPQVTQSATQQNKGFNKPPWEGCGNGQTSTA